ncbi:MAG: hypothetical protein K0R46_1056, partial [Herbinix sp.]|nr:hypothetical protein [Herbinix sp.]
MAKYVIILDYEYFQIVAKLPGSNMEVDLIWLLMVLLLQM